MLKLGALMMGCLLVVACDYQTTTPIMAMTDDNITVAYASSFAGEGDVKAVATGMPQAVGSRFPVPPSLKPSIGKASKSWRSNLE